MTAVQSRHVLDSEATVVLGNGEVLRAREKLGEGSFGAVWRMEGPRSGSLALKETISDSTESYQQSVSEARLLQRLGAGAGAGAGGCATGMPRYIGHEGAMVGEGRWRMRLLMSVVSGEPLDQWLHRSGSAQDFHAAVLETRELASQLANTMAKVESLCMHRDISSHNIMVERVAPQQQGAAGLRFSLIDFGLAVEKLAWRTQWNNLNLAGDCKYWPPCSWTLFVYGPLSVSFASPEGRQYVQGLDVFSLGITCVEFLVHRTPPGCAVSRQLRETWTEYWRATGECWELFYACFKRNGNWEQLRETLRVQNTPLVISRKLADVLESLRRLAVAHKEDPQLSSLFSTIIYMLAVSNRQRPGSLAAATSSLADRSQTGAQVDFPGVLRQLQTSVPHVSQKQITPQNYTPSAGFSHLRSPTVYTGGHEAAFSFKQPVLGDFRSPLFMPRNLRQN